MAFAGYCYANVYTDMYHEASTHHLPLKSEPEMASRPARGEHRWLLERLALRPVGPAETHSQANASCSGMPPTLQCTSRPAQLQARWTPRSESNWIVLNFRIIRGLLALHRMVQSGWPHKFQTQLLLEHTVSWDAWIIFTPNNEWATMNRGSLQDAQNFLNYFQSNTSIIF